MRRAPRWRDWTATRGPEDLAADLIESWGAVEAALRSLVGTTVLAGQPLIREARQRQLINFDQANALAEFQAVRRSRAGHELSSDRRGHQRGANRIPEARRRAPRRCRRRSSRDRACGRRPPLAHCAADRLRRRPIPSLRSGRTSAAPHSAVGAAPRSPVSLAVVVVVLLVSRRGGGRLAAAGVDAYVADSARSR